MDVSYNKLYKLLIDKGMKKTDLRIATGISPNTLTKLSKNEYVSMEVLVKICRVLECDFGDIVEIIKTNNNDQSFINYILLGGQLMGRKEYSANMVKLSFWFSEFRKVILLLNSGKTIDEIKSINKEENIFFCTN